MNKAIVNHHFYGIATCGSTRILYAMHFESCDNGIVTGTHYVAGSSGDDNCAFRGTFQEISKEIKLADEDGSSFEGTYDEALDKFVGRIQLSPGEDPIEIDCIRGKLMPSFCGSCGRVYRPYE